MPASVSAFVTRSAVITGIKYVPGVGTAYARLELFNNSPPAQAGTSTIFEFNEQQAKFLKVEHRLHLNEFISATFTGNYTKLYLYEKGTNRPIVFDSDVIPPPFISSGFYNPSQGIVLSIEPNGAGGMLPQGEQLTGFSATVDGDPVGILSAEFIDSSNAQILLDVEVPKESVLLLSYSGGNVVSEANVPLEETIDFPIQVEA